MLDLAITLTVAQSTKRGKDNWEKAKKPSLDPLEPRRAKEVVFVQVGEVSTLS